MCNAVWEGRINKYHYQNNTNLRAYCQLTVRCRIIEIDEGNLGVLTYLKIHLI